MANLIITIHVSSVLSMSVLRKRLALKRFDVQSYVFKSR